MSQPRTPSSPSLPASPVVPRPLVVTASESLLDDLLRLAAAAGVDVEVTTEAATARQAWRAAPLVVVGADMAVDVGRRHLPRRDGVVLVSSDLDDADVWERAVGIGAERVVFLPDAENWLVARIGDALDGTPGRAVVLAVLGGRGGAGATTLAAGLAVTAVRRGLRTLLVDADPLGGGIDLVFGSEAESGLRWPDLGDTAGRVSGSALRQALPDTGGLSLLSWDRGARLDVPGEAADAALGAATRTADLVVVDLPRRLDDAAEEALARAATTLLLVPAEVRATAAASRVAASVAGQTQDLRLVVRGPAPSKLPAAVIADLLGLPLLGEMRPEPGLAATLERGVPPARNPRAPLARLCARALDALVPADASATAA